LATNSDFKDLLQRFNALEVRYLVVGGYALAFHAQPRFTKDVDIWVEPAAENASRVYRAVANFGAPLDGVSEADFTTPGVVFQMGMPPNRIDILTAIDGVDFPGAWARRVSGIYDGVPVHYLSREDLITNKTASDRPQDRIDVELLKSTRPEPER